MRLRGAKVDLEAAGEETDGMANSVSELQAKLIALTGVDIMKDPNTFKSTFEIIGEMSKVWADLTDVNKAAALELMGGKRQGNILQSMIVNFEDAQKASETAANSSGSAWKENDKYLESINGRLAQFQATFQSIVNQLIQGGTISWFINAGTSILNISGKILTSLNGWTARIAAILALIKVVRSLHLISGIKSALDVTKKLSVVMGLLNKDIIAQAAADTGVAISTEGATLAERKAIVQKMGLGAATKFVTAELWEQVKAQAAALASNPVTWIVAGTAALVGLGAILIKSIKTTQDWEKQLDESSEKFKENVSELQSLQSEIDSIGDKIDELNSKDKLTLTEENELKRLKAENAELSRKIALTKIAKEYSQKQVMSDFVGTASSFLDTKSYLLTDTDYTQWVESGEINESDVDFGGQNATDSERFLAEGSYIVRQINHLKELRQQLAKSQNKADQKVIEEEITSTESFISERQKKLQEYLDKLDGIEYKDFTEETKDAYDRIQTIFDRILVSNGQVNVKDILSQPRFEKANDYIESLGNNITPEQLQANEAVKQFVDYLVEIGLLKDTTDLSSLALDFSSVDTAAQGAANSVSTYATSIKSITDIAKTLGDQSSKITNALKDITSDGVVSGAHISDLFESFSTTEGFENAIKVLTSGTSSAAEMKTALENLWGSYIKGSGILSNVTEENYNYVVSLLRAHGVTNAQEVATQSLVKKLTDLAIADGVVTEEEWNKIEAQLQAANVNSQLITKYQELVNAVVNAQTRMNSAWAQGVRARLEAVKVDIASLSTVAGAYAAVQKIREQNTVSNPFGTRAGIGIGSFTLPGTDKIVNDINGYSSLIRQLNSAQRNLDSFLVNLNTDINIDSSALDKSGSSSSSSSKDTVKDAFDNARAVLDAEKEKMDKEMPWNTSIVKNTQDYYNKLEIIANKYYKNSAKHADDYTKVMREIAEGRFKLRQDLVKEANSDSDKLIEIWRNQDARRDNNGNFDAIIKELEAIKTRSHEAAEEYRRLMKDYMTPAQIENSSFIQEMQSAWWKADEQQQTETRNKFKKELEYRQHLLETNVITEQDYIKWLNDAYQRYFGNQKKYADDYRKYLEEVYDKLKSLYKKRLDQQMSDLKDFYDKQKKLLDEQKSAEEKADQEAEKRQNVNELRETIAELSRDTSTAAQKKMASLRSQLADAEKELADFERDNAYDRTAEMLEQWYQSQEEIIQSKLDAIDEDVGNLNNNTAGIYAIIKQWANTLGINIPNPPTYANGTMSSRGGYAVVGEHRKAELIANRLGGNYQLLSPNSMVFNGDQTKSLWHISKNPAEFLASKVYSALPARAMAGGNISPMFNFDWTVMANDASDFKNNLKSYSLEITKTVLEGLKKLK